MKANHSNLKLNQEINVELTGILYRNLTLGLTGILLLITVLFWQIYFDTPSKPVLIWYLILTANLLGGFIVIYWYSQTKKNYKLQPYHFYAYIIGSSITAILLGIIGSVIMPNNIEQQMLTILIIIGVTGASVQNLHASYLASFCYLSFSLFPLLVWEGVQTFYYPQTYIGIFSATIMFAAYLVVDVYSGYILLLNNIKMRIEKDRQNTRMEILSTMVHKFQLIGKEEEIYKLFSTYICQLINNDFSLNYYDYEIRTNTFKKILTMNNFVTEEKRHEALSLINQHLNSGNATPDSKNYQNKSFSMPIKNGDELIGRLDVIFTANPASIEEVNILNRAVDDFALAISNIRLRNHLNNLSIHDALTNLYNRHYLDNVVNHVLLKAKRYKYKVCFIIIDIDFFKKFNDSFGHEIGDLILKKFGHYIRNFFRETDLVFRYGGEEFLIILENISFNNSLLRINQFRDFIKENPFDLKNKKHILRFSAGAAFYPDHGEDFDTLVNAADKALYRAKKTGRNRVCFAELDLVT